MDLRRKALRREARPRQGDARGDPARLLVPEEPALARVRVERRHGEARPLLAQRVEQAGQPVGARRHRRGGDRRGHGREGEVRGDEGGRQLSRGERHHHLGRAEALGEVLGVPAEALASRGAAGGDGVLGDRAGDQRGRDARAHQIRGLVDPGELGRAGRRVGPAVRRGLHQARAPREDADRARPERGHRLPGGDRDEAPGGDAAELGGAADHRLVADEHAAGPRAPRGGGHRHLRPDAAGAADADGQRGTPGALHREGSSGPADDLRAPGTLRPAGGSGPSGLRAPRGRSWTLVSSL